MAPNPVAIIKEDHRMVEDLFAEYKTLGDTDYDQKQAIAHKISAALTKHAEMEETLAYPRFKEVMDDEEDKLVEEAYAEHEVAKHLIAELKSLSPEDPQFDAKVTVLEESIAHHVKEEEEDLLPRAERDIPEDVMEVIGTEMLAFKDGNESDEE